MNEPEEFSKEISMLRKQIKTLEQRCSEAEEALDAIRRGAVDALVMYGDEGEKIYTIQGAESPYRLMVEAINEGAATLIEDGTILYCNHRFAEMLKTPLETVIGTSIHQYISPENKAPFSALLRRGLKENCRAEINLLCKDGSLIPVMASMNNFSPADIPGVCLVTTDLTERKIAAEMTALAQLKTRAEAELRKAHVELEKTNEELRAEITERMQTEEILQGTQQVFQTVVEYMPTAVTLIRGSDLRVQLVNPAYQSIAPGKEMRGHTLDEIWSETGQNFTAICRRVLDTGEPYRVVDELNMIRRFPDGPLEPAYFNWSLFRVRLPGDQGWGLLNTAWDSTARKIAEDALNESHRKYQALIETTGDFIWEIDPQGRYTYCSPQMETLWGLKPKEMIGKTPFDAMPSEAKEEALKRFLKTASAALPFRGLTTTSFNSQGHIIFIETSGVPFFDRDGRLLGYRGITRDVTERKWAEEKLRNAYDELEQRVQERTRQLITVNEELKAEVSERERAEKTALSNAQLAEGLAQSVIALSSSLDLDYVFTTILDQIARAIPSRLANITVIEGDNLRVVRSFSPQEYPDATGVLATSFSLEDYPLWKQVYTTQQPVLVEDTSASPDWRVAPGMEWVRSFCAVPLAIEGQVIGLINLNGDHPGAFNQETMERLMAFAAPAALAVRNARLYTAESHARQVAEAMSSLSLALTRTLDLNTVLTTLLDYLPGLISLSAAYIATVEQEWVLLLRAVHGYESDPAPKHVTGDTFDTWEIPNIQEVLTTQKSLLIRDTRHYRGWDTLVARSEMRSWVGIPIKLGDKVMGIVGLAHVRPDQFSKADLRLIESVVSQVSVAIQNAWLFEQVRAGQERFQSLSRHLVEVQESERRYIARELHDETSQALTAIMFGLRCIEQEADHPDKLLGQVTEVKRLTDEVLESLHRLAMNLRPASLDHLGLVPALEQLVKEVADRYRLVVRFKPELSLEAWRLPDYMETALYRIVQEALTNTARHAHANHADVILKLQEGKVLAIVEDDGVGFKTDEIRESNKLGLVGMQERAEMMGGSLQIESRPGGGTTIVVEVGF